MRSERILNQRHMKKIDTLSFRTNSDNTHVLPLRQKLLQLSAVGASAKLFLVRAYIFSSVSLLPTSISHLALIFLKLGITNVNAITLSVLTPPRQFSIGNNLTKPNLKIIENDMRNDKR